jgi:hypothetical protein
MIKVKGYSHLYRDENTGAIINSDSTSYNQYVNSLNKKEIKRKEIDEIKKDIEEIKGLLKELLSNRS